MDPYHSQRGMLMPLALAALLIAAALLGSLAASRPGLPAPAAPTPSPSLTPMTSASVPASPTASPSVSFISEFSMAGYMNAVRTGKLVLLAYSSSACAGCEAAFTTLADALQGMADARLAAFRVDYGDSAADEQERAAAETFGIGAPHMLAVVRKGTLAAKEDVSGWDEARFRAAIAEYLR